jgi:hypothetical protein
MDDILQYKVYDDVVSKELADKVEETLTSDMFPWFCMKKSIYPEWYQAKFDDSENYKDVRSLGHTFTVGEPPVINSAFIGIPLELLQQISNKLKIDNNNLLRIRANYMYPLSASETYLPASPHVDGSYKHLVLLYYVNDSDGDTILYKDPPNILTTISPKKGRFVIFDGSILHAASPPRFNDTRIVINYNLIQQ